MRTVRITLTVKIDERENGLTEDDFDPHHLRTLMMDALGEFKDKREPAQAYVEKRYPELITIQSYKLLVEKLKSIELRNKLASALHNADVSVEETDDEPAFEILNMKIQTPLEMRLMAKRVLYSVEHKVNINDVVSLILDPDGTYAIFCPSRPDLAYWTTGPRGETKSI